MVKLSWLIKFCLLNLKNDKGSQVRVGRIVEWNFMSLQNDSKKSICETSFLLIYGTEAMILAEIGCSSHRVVHYTLEGNEQGLRTNLNFLKKLCLTAAVKNDVYRLRTTQYHNTRVMNRRF